MRRKTQLYHNSSLASVQFQPELPGYGFYRLLLGSLFLWVKTVVVHHYRRLYDLQCKSVMKYSVFDDHAYYMNFTNNEQDQID